MTATISDHRALFLSGVPLMDVRAPVEFEQGAFPGARNLPLLDDGEREQVGTSYTRHGQQAAIELGHRLLAGDHRRDRIDAWARFARAHPEGVLYCFRGGLRSEITQRWLKEEAGIDYPRVAGGYKAMRNFLLDTLRLAAAEPEWMVVGGLTGTGKTDLILALDNGIDLEAHANHRGSSFGKRVLPQPAQIDFENRLAVDLLRRRAAGTTWFVAEDEGRNVGRCCVPGELAERMRSAPLVWLEDTFEARVERILRDYVVLQRQDFDAVHGPEQGFARFADHLQQGMDGIARRLGGERHQRLSSLLREALAIQAREGDVAAHREWIAGLLREYYDPMYSYQREQKAGRIVCAGDRDTVLSHLRREAPGLTAVRGIAG
jgi:tRNA 2-selenouridine synthase